MHLLSEINLIKLSFSGVYTAPVALNKFTQAFNSVVLAM